MDLIFKNKYVIVAISVIFTLLLTKLSSIIYKPKMTAQDETYSYLNTAIITAIIVSLVLYFSSQDFLSKSQEQVFKGEAPF